MSRRKTLLPLPTPVGFTHPKEGEAANDDAFGCAQDGSSASLICVADGATEAFHAREWAQFLVAALTAAPAGDRVADGCMAFWERVAHARRQWEDAVDAIEVPWYAEQNAAAGAFAALALLHLSAAHQTWWGLAIGDVCILHLRQHHLIHAWPLTSKAAFNNHPQLLGVRPSRLDEESLQQIGGRYKNGDLFLVASDAIAAWLIGQWEQAGVEGISAFLDQLTALEAAERQNEADIAIFTADLRRAGMRNDDMTVVLQRTVR